MTTFTEIMSPINNTTKTIVPGSVTNVELVSPDSNKNPKGQQGGTFNVKDGTLYFVNRTCDENVVILIHKTKWKLDLTNIKSKVVGIYSQEIWTTRAPAFSEIA